MGLCGRGDSRLIWGRGLGAHFGLWSAMRSEPSPKLARGRGQTGLRFEETGLIDGGAVATAEDQSADHPLHGRHTQAAVGDRYDRWTCHLPAAAWA